MLDLDRLRALHAVATHGSVSAAAEALHVTTSAVSQQLAKLERETAHKLLERNGRGVKLTDVAWLLVAHAERILALVERAEADLEAHRGVVAGEMTVAAFPSAIRGLIPAALAALRTAHPRLRVRVHECDPAESLPLTSRGDIDLAIVQDWNNEPLPVPEGLAKGMICEDVADVALPADHPLADRDVVALTELAGDRWISSTPGSICCDWLVHTLRSFDNEPRIDHMADEFATQLALVAGGLGNAILPRLGRCDIPEGVRLVALRPALIRRVFAVWREEAARRPAICAALDALRAAGRRDVPADPRRPGGPATGPH
ncbi:LysR family transcriptional regulator [Thermomonospora catenispora]|uniref:LysR family transcriptional regulator n=1 Tax=Thermomonospora catenispora TaxID=2493090 RepID=UPI00111D0791|nr:LysR family transcriptional regulator [Thermomonospora catenispora]TNY38904.1 LysR family transcriptional regulator [Thermomonospora catenispora]